MVSEISRLAALAFAALLVAGCVTAGPSSSPIGSQSPFASTSPPPAATATSGVNTSYALGYRIDMPAPWRRSACLSSEVQTQLPAGDGFVRVAEQDERGSDVGYAFDVVQVRVEPNPDGLTPERWVASGKIGSTDRQTIEPATLDGRSALLVRPSGVGGFTFVLAVDNRMFVIGYQNAYNDTSNEPAMERIVRSFHLLTEQERAAAPPPAAVTPRSADTLVDTIADGFARLDTDRLATAMAPCMAAAAEQAGGTFAPRSAYASQLRDAFANGLRVVVQRPKESDATGWFVKATWTQPGVPTQRRDLYLRANGEVWSWYLILTRQPVR